MKNILVTPLLLVPATAFSGAISPIQNQCPAINFNQASDASKNAIANRYSLNQYYALNNPSNKNIQSNESIESDEKQLNKQEANIENKDYLKGKIIRCAARSYDKEASKPSSSKYTTRKNELPLIHITPAGVTGDHNHYRTTVLKSTPDRALSILTTDVMQTLKSNQLYSEIQNGDLGENILIEGLPYHYFKLGGRYELGNKLIVEITERIEPCANLCKLHFINKASLAPKERIQRCIQFLKSMDDIDGQRGWYAKIIGDGGVVKIGDEVKSILSPA